MINQNSNSRKDKSGRHDCLDCENYKRKIKECEQTVSSRDVVIQMLQREIQKFEEKYKKSVDEYERLRFAHCTTLQELSNLKDIHKKLEEDYEKLNPQKTRSKKDSEGVEETYRNQYFSQGVSFQDACYLKSLNKETIQNKNEERRGGLMTDLLKEVNGTKCCSENIVKLTKADKGITISNSHEYVSIVEEMTKQIKDLNEFVTKLKTEFTIIVENMQKQIEKSNAYVEKLENENGDIKGQLQEKKSILSSCLCVLEQNHSDITNLSSNIEGIIHEKELLLQETINLKKTIDEHTTQCMEKDQEICELKCKLDYMSKEKELEKEELRKCRDCVLQLQQQLSERDTTIKTERSCACKQLQQSEESNKVLSDTLMIMTDENKANLNKISCLSVDLKKVNEELEKSERTLKKYISELEENDECMKKQCGNENSEKLEELKQLQDKINFLEAEVKELSLENSEYEEENRYYCQKIEDLTRDTRFLEEENFKIEENNKDWCTKLEKLQKQHESVQEELKRIRHEYEELQHRYSICSNENDDIKNKSDILADELKRSEEDKGKVEKENENLRYQMQNYSNNGSWNDKTENENDSLKEELKKIQDEKDRMGKEIDDLKRITNNEKNELQNKMDEMYEHLITTKEEKAKVEKHNINLNNQMGKLTQHFDAYDNENEDVKKRIDTVNEKLKMVREEKEWIEKEYANLKKQMENVLEDCFECTNKNDKIKMEVELINEEYKKTLEEKAATQEENQNLKNEIENLKQQYIDRQSEIDKMVTKLDTLSEKLKNCEKNKKELEEENKNLKGETVTHQCNSKNNTNNKDTTKKTDAMDDSSNQQEEKSGSDDVSNGKLIEQLRQYSINADENGEMKRKIDAILADALIEYEILRNSLGAFGNMTVPEINLKIDKLNNDIKIAQEENRKQEIENDSLKSEKEKLRHRASDYEKSIAGMKNEIQNLVKELEILQKRTNEIENENESLRNQLERISEHNEKMKSELNRTNENLKEAQDELRKLEIENKKMKNQMEQMIIDYEDRSEKIKIVKLSSELEVAQEKLRKIENEKENLKSQVKQMQSDFQQCEIVEIDRVKQKLKEAEEENENLRSQIKKLDQQFVDTSSYNGEVEKKIDMMNYELKAAREDKMKIENENKALKDKINNLQKELIESHEQAEKEILRLQQKIDELEDSQQDKSEQISICCQEMGSIKKILHEQESRRATLERENLQMLEEMKPLKEKLEKLQLEKKELEIDLCERECMIRHLEECLSETNKTLEVCDNEIKDMHRRIENLQIENEEVKQQLQKYVYESEVSKAEVESLQEKLSTTRRQSKQIEMENTELLGDLQKKNTLEVDLATLTQTYNALLKTAEEKDEEFCIMREQYESLKQSLEITKSEYEKIKRSYKDLRSSLTEQLTNYRAEIETSNEENINSYCQSEQKFIVDSHIEELELKIIEKEMEIQILQHKNADLTSEISKLKENVHKLVSYNNVLKETLKKLFNTLVTKLKTLGNSSEDISDYHVSLLANGIMESLRDIEKGIALSNSSSIKSKCSCMAVIMSKYKLAEDTGSCDTPTGSIGSKKITDVMKFEEKNFKTSSEMLNILTEVNSEDQAEQPRIHEVESVDKSKSVKGINVDLENHPDDSQTEPFTIEPDDSMLPVIMWH